MMVVASVRKDEEDQDFKIWIVGYGYGSWDSSNGRYILK